MPGRVQSLEREREGNPLSAEQGEGPALVPGTWSSLSFTRDQMDKMGR